MRGPEPKKERREAYEIFLGLSKAVVILAAVLLICVFVIPAVGVGIANVASKYTAHVQQNRARAMLEERAKKQRCLDRGGTITESSSSSWSCAGLRTVDPR
jgi:hypothetical protein